MTRKDIRALAAAASVLLSVGHARASLLFSDSFTYPAGALNGDANPDAGDWSAFSGSPTVVSPGLSYPGLASAGNEVELQAANGDGAAITLPSTAGGGSTGNVWLSFLFDASATSFSGFADVGLGSSSGDSVSVGLINNTSVYGIDDDLESPVIRGTTSVLVGTTLQLVVADFDFSTGEEYIWLDPSLSSTPSTASANASVEMLTGVQTDGFDDLAVNSGGSSADYNVDEIRLGTTFTDIAPIPEPGSVALLALGIPALFVWKKARRTR